MLRPQRMGYNSRPNWMGLTMVIASVALINFAHVPEGPAAWGAVIISVALLVLYVAAVVSQRSAAQSL